jgi:hypothetical protein
MQWDLGIAGLGLLLAMSLVFGLLAQLAFGRAQAARRWVGAIAAAAFFVCGLMASEVWFGWATEEELQPNIDGLSFDEALLFGLLGGVASVLVTRYLIRKQHRRA